MTRLPEKICLINLDKIEISTFPNYVFYLTDKEIIYKDKAHLIYADCNNNILSALSLPVDHKNYQFLDLGGRILILFAGKTFCLFDKNSNQSSCIEFNHKLYGRCITKIFKGKEENTIIFGTKLHTRIQLICYNFVENKRIYQSSSWQANEISDLIESENSIFILLDKTLLFECGFDCEIKWNRFEVTSIKENLIYYDNSVVYTCRDIIRKVNKDSILNTKLTGLQITSLLCEKNGKLYFTTNEKKNISCYDIKNEKLLWELKGHDKILQAIMGSGEFKNEVHDILVLRFASHIGIVDLTTVRSIYYVQLDNIREIKISGKNILLQKYIGMTDVINGTD